MTALIVLRPDLQETAQRAWQRGLGTIVGVGISGAIISATAHDTWVLVGGASLFAMGSYALFPVGYGYFAGFLTGYVVFLLSVAGIGEEVLIVHRLIFTLCGVALALGIHGGSALLRKSTSHLRHGDPAPAHPAVFDEPNSREDRRKAG